MAGEVVGAGAGWPSGGPGRGSGSEATAHPIPEGDSRGGLDSSRRPSQVSGADVSRAPSPEPGADPSRRLGSRGGPDPSRHPSPDSSHLRPRRHLSLEPNPDTVPLVDAAPDLVAADTALASRLFKTDSAPGKLAGRTVLLPFTTVAELATWPERLLWGHARTEELCLWVDSRRMILGDDTVARIWGRIVVAAERAGGGPSASDAWIAAGCLSYGLPLATLNARPYQYFADRYGLELL